MRLLDAARKRGNGVQVIVLAPWTSTMWATYSADTLHCDPKHTSESPNLVPEKIGGKSVLCHSVFNRDC